MPVETRILAGHGLVYHRYSGVVLLEELQAEMQRTLGNPEYDPAFNEIVDMRDAEETRIDSMQLLSHAQDLLALQEQAGAAKTMYLVAGNELGFGMARMFQGLAGAGDPRLVVHVVTEIDEAKRLLGVEDAPI